MHGKITFVRDVHSYDTRLADNIFITTAKKEITNNSLFYKSLAIYNSLPVRIKTIESINEFKRKCCEWVKQIC